MSEPVTYSQNWNDATTDQRNTSNQFLPGIPFGRKILYECISIILTLVVLYIAIALFRFNWARDWCGRQRRRSSGSTQNGSFSRRTKNDSVSYDSSASNSASSPGSYKRESRRDSRILQIICFVAALLTLSRVVSEQIELLPANTDRVDCRIYQIVMVVTFCLAMAALYIVLWFRVRIFILHPAMKHLVSGNLRFIVYLVFALIISAAGVNASIFLITGYSVEAEGGCKTMPVTNTISLSGRFALLVATTVFSQISLLSLFLYPLIKHRVSMKKMSLKYKSNDTKKDDVPSIYSPKFTPKEEGLKRKPTFSKKKKRQLAILKIIRRVMITASACAVTDIFSAIVVSFLGSSPRIVINLIYDVNLVVNLACVMISFQDWRVRLFPECIGTGNGAKAIKRNKSQKSTRNGRHSYDVNPSSPPVRHSRQFFHADVKGIESIAATSSVHATESYSGD